VLYAVLLAFVIVVVWEKFSDEEANVVRAGVPPRCAVAGFKFATVGRIGHTPVSLASMLLFLTSQSPWIPGAKHRRWRQAAAVAGRARVARAEA
jgi:hypothetical protein